MRASNDREKLGAGSTRVEANCIASADSNKSARASNENEGAKGLQDVAGTDKRKRRREGVEVREVVNRPAENTSISKSGKQLKEKSPLYEPSVGGAFVSACDRIAEVD